MSHQHFKLLHQVFNYGLLRFLRNCLPSIQQSTKAGNHWEIWCFTKRGSREHAKFLMKKDDCALRNAVKGWLWPWQWLGYHSFLKVPGSHIQHAKQHSSKEHVAVSLPHSCKNMSLLLLDFADHSHTHTQKREASCLLCSPESNSSGFQAGTGSCEQRGNKV